MSTDTSVYDRPSRSEAAVALRVSGATYTQIARTLEYNNAAQARTAVERALAETVSPSERDTQREIATRRLESILLGLWHKATDPNDPEHLAASRTALSVVDRYIRLYGLDAPAQMLVYTPAGNEIAEWVAQMLATQRAELPAEVDIIEGDILDDTA